MSGNKLLVDTNIFLYLLNGDTTIAELLTDKEVYLSVISELELYSWQNISVQEEEWINLLISECFVMDINNGIKQIAIQLRKKYKIKLPDAIVASTAIFLGIPFLSADKGFEKIQELSFIRYIP